MNPTIATWMLFLHVLAALWLAAGVFSGSVVRAQGRKAATPGERVLALRIAWRLANVYSLPGGIVAGLLGIGLLHPRGWTFGALWVQISMTLWLAMLLNGILYLQPTLKKMIAAASASAAAGVSRQEVARVDRAKGPRIAAELNALGIVVITLLMIFKPV